MKTLIEIEKEIDSFVEEAAKEAGINIQDENYYAFFKAAYLKSKLSVAIFMDIIEINEFRNIVKK